MVDGKSLIDPPIIPDVDLIHFKNWGCPAELLTNQTVLNQKVHDHTLRAPQVGIKPTSPPMQAVALPTKPQILQRPVCSPIPDSESLTEWQAMSHFQINPAKHNTITTVLDRTFPPIAASTNKLMNHVTSKTVGYTHTLLINCISTNHPKSTHTCTLLKILH